MSDRPSLCQFLRHFLREPMFGLRYRREWGEWPLIWKWEDDDGGY